MSRIKINDLPAIQDLSPEELQEIFGAGRPTDGPFFRSSFEPLENRELMASSLTASLSGGVLRIEGTNSADQIRIVQNSDQLSVGGLNIQSGGSSVASIPASSVQHVEILPLGGNDQIWLGAAGLPLDPSVSLLDGVAGDLVYTRTRPAGVAVAADVTESVQRNDGTVFALHADGGVSINGTRTYSGYQDMAIGQDGTLYLHAINGRVKRMAADNTWLTQVFNVVKVVPGIGGSFYTLNQDAGLYRWTAAGASTLLDGQVTSVVPVGGGKVAYLQASALRSDDGQGPVLQAGNVHQVAVLGGGKVAYLQGAAIYVYDGQSHVLQTAFSTQMAQLTRGRVAYLATTGALYALDGAGAANLLASNVSRIAQAGNRVAYLQNNTLYITDGANAVQQSGYAIQIAQMSGGRLAYLTTTGALYATDGATSQLQTSNVLRIAELSGGRVAYLTTTGTLYAIDGASHGQLAGNVRQLVQLSFGRVAYLQGNALYVINGASHDLQTGYATQIAELAGGQLAYLTTAGTLYAVTSNSHVQQAGNVSRIEELSGGRVAYLQNHVLHTFDGTNHAQQAGNVSQLAQLSAGRIAYVQNQSLYFIEGTTHNLQTGFASQIAELSGGRLAYLTTTGVLYAVTGTSHEQQAGNVSRIAELSGGRVAYLQNSALYAIDGTSHMLQAGNVQQMAQLSGNRVAYLQNGALYAIDGTNHILQAGNVSDFAAGSGGNAYFLQNGVIWKTDGGAATTVSGGGFRDIAVDVQNQLYGLGDNGSLFCWPTGQLGNYTLVDRFVDSFIINASGNYQVTNYNSVGLKWESLGGAAGVLGAALDTVDTPSGIEIHHFANGDIYWLGDAARVYAVTGGIWQGYTPSAARLGNPTGDASSSGDFRWQNFDGGVVYWSAATGGHAILGNPGDPNTFWGKFAQAGYQNGIGLPVDDVQNALDMQGSVIGTVQHFQRGAIFLVQGQARAVSGPIWEKYVTTPGLASTLGLPTTDLQDVAGAKVIHFQGGSIYWHAATGSYVLRNDLFATNVDSLFERSYMQQLVGLHTPGENTIPLRDVMYQLADNPSGASPELLAQLAIARGRSLEGIKVEYLQFLRALDQRNQNADKDHQIDRLWREHPLFMGSTNQLRYGKVVGDAFGIDPVFGSLLNPTGGLVGPGDQSLDATESPVSYHGIVHDAGGYLYNFHGHVGPGYDYLRLEGDPSNKWSGQRTGIPYWIAVLGFNVTENGVTVGLPGVGSISITKDGVSVLESFPRP